jgi:hypothetical protein
MRRKFGRPSAPMVVSSIALVVALSGSGAAVAAVALAPNSVTKSKIATGAVGKSEIRNNAVGKGEIKKGAVGKSEVRKDAVGTSEVKDGELDASDLKDGLLVEAYATIDPDPATGTGPVLVGTGKGVTGVSRPATEPTGVYCLTVAAGVPVTNNHAQVTMDLANSASVDLVAHVASTSTTCASGQVEVRTYDTSGAAAATLTNDAAFNILIP